MFPSVHRRLQCGSSLRLLYLKPNYLSTHFLAGLVDSSRYKWNEVKNHSRSSSYSYAVDKRAAAVRKATLDTNVVVSWFLQGVEGVEEVHSHNGGRGNTHTELTQQLVAIITRNAHQSNVFSPFFALNLLSGPNFQGVQSRGPVESEERACPTYLIQDGVSCLGSPL